jgi:hypothetical protein
MNIFEVFYWTAILLEIAIRIPLQKARKKIPRSEQHISRAETFLLGGLFVTMVLIPGFCKLRSCRLGWLVGSVAFDWLDCNLCACPPGFEI